MMYFKKMEPLTKKEQDFVTKNMPLVYYLLKRFSRFRRVVEVADEDLIQWGAMGLMRAAKSFDPKVSESSHYASLWIKRAFEYAYIDDRNVRVPQQRHLRRNSILSAMFKDPTLTIESEEIRKIAKTDKPENIQALLDEQTMFWSDSMDETKGSKHGNTDWGTTKSNASLHEEIPSDEPTPEDKAIKRETSKELSDAIDKLRDYKRAEKVPKDMKKIVMREIGIGGRTYDDVGLQYGVSRQRIEQIMKKSLDELRRIMVK